MAEAAVSPINIKITGFSDEQLATLGIDKSKATDGYVSIDIDSLTIAQRALLNQVVPGSIPTVHLKVTGFTDDQLAGLGIDKSKVADGYADVDTATLTDDQLKGLGLAKQTTSTGSTKVVIDSDPVEATDNENAPATDVATIGNYAPEETMPDYAAMDWMDAPTLYETSAADLLTTGLALLSEATATVSEATSAPYTLQLSYPLNGPDANELQMDRVIMADAGYKLKRQLFRIDTIEPNVPSSGEATVEVKATHVAGDILNNVLKKDVVLSNATATQAFSAVLDALVEPMPRVTYTSDIMTMANVNWTKGTTIEDIMFGRSAGGTDMETLYDGEWAFDNYNMTFNHSAGENTQMLIRPGKNMLTYSSSNTLDDVVTAIYPYATYTPGEDGAPGDKSNIADYSGVGTVQWVGKGSVPIWDTPFKGQKKTGKELKNGTYFKTFSVVTEGSVNGKTWYCLGGDQWIDATYFTFSKTGDYNIDLASNKAIGQGTIGYNLDNAQSKRHISNLRAVGTVNYAGKGKVAVWNKPFKPHRVIKYETNGSSWNVFQQATDENDHVWYCLGGDQWIDSSYLVFSKKNDYETQIASDARIGYLHIVGHQVKMTSVVVTGRYKSGKKKGKVKTTKKVTKTQVGAEVYTKPGSAGKKTGKVLPVKSPWRIFGVADGGDGNTWYDLGGGQWVKDDDVSFDGQKDVEPKAPEEKDDEQDPGVAIVYDNPGIKGKPTGKQLKSGTQWKIFGQATTADGTWYNLGGSQWIDANFMTFDKPTDVEPNTDGGTGAEPEEQTVTLDEVMMTAAGAEKYEHQHLEAVDLSGYGVYDQDTLREVAKAYMSDNQIGHLTYTLTVTFEEFTGEFAGLSEVGMYDQVVVYLPQMAGDSAGEVIAVEWDVNRHKPSSVSIGSRPAQITNLMQKYAKDAEDNANSATSQAEAAAQAAVDASRSAMQEWMDEQLGKVVDGFNTKADAFEDRVAMAEKTADKRDKDLRDELNNFDEDINAKFETYKTGFDAKVSALDGRLSETTQTISGVQTLVQDPTTGLSSLSRQLAGLIKTQVTGDDLTSLREQTESLIEDKITGVNGQYSKLAQMVDGIESSVGDGTVDSRILQMKNEIGSEIRDTKSQVTTLIDQKVEDGIGSISLVVKDRTDGNIGLMIQGGDGKTGSTAILNVAKAFTNNLQALGSLSMDDGTGTGTGTAISRFGVTVTGGSKPTIQIGSPSKKNGILGIFGDAFIHGGVNFKTASSTNINGGDGVNVEYLANGFNGAGLYVTFGGGSYCLVNYQGKTNVAYAKAT